MFQRQLLTWFLAVAVALLWPGLSAASFMLPPKTLWKLAGAEAIVLARVTSVSKTGMEVDLQVVERWKGTPGDTLRMRKPLTEPGSRITSSFPAGGMVVAFLMDPVQDTWWGYDFGVFPVKTEGDIAAFRGRVKEAVAAWARAAPPEEPPREWSLLAASHPATRWHGLYHLLGHYNVSFRLFLPAPKLPLPKQPLLTKEEQQRLAASFVASPGDPRQLGLVLMALQDYPDPAVDRAAVASMDAWLSEAPDSEAGLMPVTVKVLASRLGISGSPPGPRKVIPAEELLELPYPRQLKLQRQSAQEHWEFVSTRYRKRARAGTGRGAR